MINVWYSYSDDDEEEDNDDGNELIHAYFLNPVKVVQEIDE
jgi:hypothetical protein